MSRRGGSMRVAPVEPPTAPDVDDAEILKFYQLNDFGLATWSAPGEGPDVTGFDSSHASGGKSSKGDGSGGRSRRQQQQQRSGNEDGGVAGVSIEGLAGDMGIQLRQEQLIMAKGGGGSAGHAGGSNRAGDGSGPGGVGSVSGSAAVSGDGDEDEEGAEEEEDGPSGSRLHRRGRGADVDVRNLKNDDPLGVYRSIFDHLSPEEQRDYNTVARYSVSSRLFSPRDFLQDVHSGTSFNDLRLGARRLREKATHESANLRTLVQRDFDKFVSARNRMDEVYEDMHHNWLNERRQYGTSQLFNTLRNASDCADEVYNPIVERRARAEKIRATLNIVERYRFFFNLPSRLMELVAKHNYEATIREYRKGLLLFQQSINNSISSGNENGIGKLLGKIWDEVQDCIDVCRHELHRELGIASRSLDQQERHIQSLVELNRLSTTAPPRSTADPSKPPVEPEDPVAICHRNQHKWILGQLQDAYTTHLARMNAFNQQSQSSNAKEPEDMAALRRAVELRRAMNINDPIELEAIFGRNPGYQKWQTIQLAVKSLSDVILRTMPDFWRLSKAFLEKRYSAPKSDDNNGTGAVGASDSRDHGGGGGGGGAGGNSSSGGGRRRRLAINFREIQQCQDMVDEILYKYATLVAAVLRVVPPSPPSSIAAMMRQQLHTRTDGNSAASTEETDPSAVSPPATYALPAVHSVISSHFMCTAIDTVVSCANDTITLRISDEVASNFRSLVDSLRNGCILYLTSQFQSDISHLYLHETWRLVFTLDPPTAVIGGNSSTSSGAGASGGGGGALRRARSVLGGIDKNVIATEYVVLFWRLLRTVLSALHQIHAAHIIGENGSNEDGSDQGGRNAASNMVVLSRPAIQALRSSFIASLFAVLDHMHALALGNICGIGVIDDILSGGPAASSTSDLDTSLFDNIVAQRSIVAESARATSDEGGRDVFRVLVTLCNLAQLRDTVMPDIFHQFARAFRIDIEPDRALLEAAARRLDSGLLSLYVRQRARQVTAIIQDGILTGGYNWAVAEVPQPHQQSTIGNSAIHPYIVQALLYIVNVHAEVSGVTVGNVPKLVHRVIRELLQAVSQSMLESFRQIDVFGEGGMIRAIVEAEFMRAVLTAYESRDSHDNFARLVGYVTSIFGHVASNDSSLCSSASSGGSGGGGSNDTSSNRHGRVNPSDDGNASSANGSISETIIRTNAKGELTQQQWSLVKKLVLIHMKRTSMQFRCFKSATSSSSTSSSSS